jgi:hypothetical protein
MPDQIVSKSEFAMIAVVGRVRVSQYLAEGRSAATRLSVAAGRRAFALLALVGIDAGKGIADPSA